MMNKVSPLNCFLTNTEKMVLKEIKEFLNSILKSRLKLFVLFGSKARGDFNLESDLDVAVVVRNLNRKLKHQILDEVAEIEFKYSVPVSMLLLSEKEFNHLKQRERRIALDIIRDGIPL
ncbi:MAG: nucleotidyltransferase domain-containing protein [Candidatus Wolframiiraptor sp.]|nr:MAG: nucleotidyltransferase domain-containing protein [Candidatus Wolframiiraptor sp.]